MDPEAFLQQGRQSGDAKGNRAPGPRPSVRGAAVGDQALQMPLSALSSHSTLTGHKSASGPHTGSPPNILQGLKADVNYGQTIPSMSGPSGALPGRLNAAKSQSSVGSSSKPARNTERQLFRLPNVSS